jgi:hypothetical protein
MTVAGQGRSVRTASRIISRDHGPSEPLIRGRVVLWVALGISSKAWPGGLAITSHGIGGAVPRIRPAGSPPNLETVVGRFWTQPVKLSEW